MGRRCGLQGDFRRPGVRGGRPHLDRERRELARRARQRDRPDHLRLVLKGKDDGRSPEAAAPLLGRRNPCLGPHSAAPRVRAPLAPRRRHIRRGEVLLNASAYEDDGAWIRLAYNLTIEAVNVRTVIDLAEQVVAEIEGAAEMRLGVELWTPSEAENEKEFTLRTVLPIVRKLGF